MFQDRGYHYLLLRSGEEGICGTSLPIRWFEDLQTNGVYIGSGGAGSSWYHRMTFQDGVFVQQELGTGRNGEMAAHMSWTGER